MKINRIIEKLLDYIYPPYASCLSCEAKRQVGCLNFLCEKCNISFQKEYCPDISISLENTDICLIPLYYKNIAKKLIKRLKFDNIKAASLPLSEAMSKLLVESNIKAEALVPVPLFEKRQKNRGFNQAQLLAEAIGTKTEIPVLNCLTRVRDTPPQRNLNKKQRKANMIAAFKSNLDLKGKTLVLVDDVLTTGATAIACSKELKNSGAKKIILLIATHGE